MRQLFVFLYSMVSLSVAAQSSCVGDCGSGVGKYITPEYTYIGQFRNNKFNGQGRIIFTSGDKFEGSFSAGNFKEGVYTYANGDTYRGSWVNGNKDGIGIYSEQNGNTWKYLYTQGQKSEIIYKKNSRNEYEEGRIVNGEYMSLAEISAMRKREERERELNEILIDSLKLVDVINNRQIIQTLTLSSNKEYTKIENISMSYPVQINGIPGNLEFVDFTVYPRFWLYYDKTVPGYMVNGQKRQYNQAATEVIVKYFKSNNLLVSSKTINNLLNVLGEKVLCDKYYYSRETVSCPKCSKWTRKDEVDCDMCGNGRRIYTGRQIKQTCSLCEGIGYYHKDNTVKEQIYIAFRRGERSELSFVSQDLTNSNLITQIFSRAEKDYGNGYDYSAYSYQIGLNLTTNGFIFK